MSNFKTLKVYFNILKNRYLAITIIIVVTAFFIGRESGKNAATTRIAGAVIGTIENAPQERCEVKLGKIKSLLNVYKNQYFFPF